MDEVAHDTCEGEGGGRAGGISMDDVFADISELRILGRPRNWGKSLNSVESSYACHND